jgi:hypothetical protein
MPLPLNKNLAHDTSVAAQASIAWQIRYTDGLSKGMLKKHSSGQGRGGVSQIAHRLGVSPATLWCAHRVSSRRLKDDICRTRRTG